MKEIPILMNGDMIRALKAGMKTQTRRPVNPQPTEYGLVWIETPEGFAAWQDNGLLLEEGALRLCPYGMVGDRLWVRETWTEFDGELLYRADGDPDAEGSAWVTGGWKPSIFMPRWASRFTLEVTEVRAQRVRAISEDDARAEGVKGVFDDWVGPGVLTYRKPFRSLWDSIYAKPQPVTGKDGQVSHYVSYPWEDVSGTHSHRGKPWYVYGNAWVWTVSFRVLEGVKA